MTSEVSVRQRRIPPAEFAPLLRTARTRAGLGSRQLARLIGVDQSYIANLEAGRRCPSTVIAALLSEALPLNDDELLLLHSTAVNNAGRSRTSQGD